MDDTDANTPRHRGATQRPRLPRGHAPPTPRIIPVSTLAPGLAMIIVSLPDRTIRSRVFMVQVQPHRTTMRSQLAGANHLGIFMGASGQKIEQILGPHNRK